MPVRQRVQHGLRTGRKLRHGGFDLGVGLEEDLDDGETGQRLRFHVLDVVDRGGEGALGTDGDDLGHLLGREPAVAPDHAGDRDVDLREDVGGHADDGQHAQDDDHHRHDDEGIGTAQRESDNPHRAICSFLHATAPVQCGLETAGISGHLSRSSGITHWHKVAGGRMTSAECAPIRPWRRPAPAPRWPWWCRPGTWSASAPCAQPSLTASSADSPVSRP